MKKQKILSIIIPTYNMQDYLCRCLDSLLIQNATLFEFLEILVINDGSKDESLRIAKEYENKYPEVIRVIDKKNGNYGSCVNRGLKEATGKYFRLLDADDWFDTTALEQFLNILFKVEAEVLCTSYALRYNNGKCVVIKNHSVDLNKVFSIDQLSMKKEDEGVLCMHSLTFKLDLLKRVGLQHQEGISYTDIEYCFFPLLKAHSIQFLNICLYQYFIGRVGQTVSRISYINSRKHLYLVSKRIIAEYVLLSDLFDLRKKLLLNLIMFPLYRYYLVNLVFSKPDSDFCEIEQLVKKSPQIINRLNNSTYKKIPFVKIWHSLNFRLSFLRFI